MKAKSWLLSGVLAASMAGAVGGASAQTYVYSVEGVPSPAGQPAAVFLGARDGEEVTATVQAYNGSGVLGDDARNVTVPGNGFVRLNNSDLALGHDTGARKVVVMAGRELNVTAMRRIWGDHAVALAVRHWVTNAVMPGCADEAEFNRLGAGKLVVVYDGITGLGYDWTGDLILGGNRFLEILEGGTVLGSIGTYTYRKTGANTAIYQTLDVTHTDSPGRLCTVNITCTTPSAGLGGDVSCRDPDGSVVLDEQFSDWGIIPYPLSE